MVSKTKVGRFPVTRIGVRLFTIDKVASFYSFLKHLNRCLSSEGHPINGATLGNINMSDEIIIPLPGYV
jgi:hypothetical protein